LTDEDDWTLDPFMGVGTTQIASIMHLRKSIGAEILPEYYKVAKERINLAVEGELLIRPMERPVFDPNTKGKYVPPKRVNVGNNSTSLFPNY
jgi:adenine-specific DNA-methyltransferase